MQRRPAPDGDRASRRHSRPSGCGRRLARRALRRPSRARLNNRTHETLHPSPRRRYPVRRRIPCARHAMSIPSRGCMNPPSPRRSRAPRRGTKFEFQGASRDVPTVQLRPKVDLFGRFERFSAPVPTTPLGDLAQAHAIAAATERDALSRLPDGMRASAVILFDHPLDPASIHALLGGPGFNIAPLYDVPASARGAGRPGGCILFDPLGRPFWRCFPASPLPRCERRSGTRAWMPAPTPSPFTSRSTTARAPRWHPSGGSSPDGGSSPLGTGARPPSLTTDRSARRLLAC